MANVTILVGAQWGDEGKGKWIDILAEDAAVVARFQGGNNAGHTLYIQGQKVVLHQIPSGAFRPGTKGVLTAGVVINPVQILEELDRVSALAQIDPSNLWLSARAHVITPWHIHLDHERERLAESPIGTTKRGIGPTYADKYARSGLRLGQYVDDELRQQWVDTMRAKAPGFVEAMQAQADDWEKFHAAAKRVRAFVCDGEARLRDVIYNGGKVLLEGAQGALLDIDHGTYPYVTSSSTMAGGAFASVGFSAKHVDQVLGVAKAYTTRVGSGPFPTELFDDAGKHLATLGKEFGATTGRPRRCGWLDAVALRYAYRANGCDGIILNKLDILSGLKEVKICVAYDHPLHGRLTDFPWDPSILAACQPVYESHPGWSEEAPRSGKVSDLPAAARAYVDAVERAIDGRVTMVGTGVNRGDALYR